MIPKTNLQHALSLESPQRVEFPDFRPSAVLLPLCPTPEGLQVLYTLRSQKVASHQGQVCFPGGIHESTDLTLRNTALRETEEELGIASDHIEILGQLDDSFTPQGYHITPFVGWIPHPVDLKPNEEIALAFWVPLKELLNPANVRLEEQEFQGKSYLFPYYQIKEQLIWGATGRMTYCLLERLKKIL